MNMSFPHTSQLNMMDCGPACLRMVARHYGRNYSLDTLRKRSFITREGVSMLGICDAAESIGMRASGVRTTVDRLIKASPFPCILHWRSNHFVVLYGVAGRHGRERFKIADPASQLVTYSREEFEKCWVNGANGLGERSGAVMVLETTPAFYEEKGEAHDGSWHGLLHYARYLLPYRRQFAQLALALLIGSVLQLIFPFLTQALVDVGVGGRHIGFITMILMAQLFLLDRKSVG